MDHLVLIALYYNHVTVTPKLYAFATCYQRKMLHTYLCITLLCQESNSLVSSLL